MATTDRDDDPEPHELFLPLAEGDPIVSPQWISVEREKPFREARGGVLAPHELPDEASIAGQFGSGTYFVRARDGRKRVICGRRIVVRNAGPPKAMDGSGETIEGFGGGPPERTPAAPPPREGPSELAALLTFMQQAQAQAAVQTQALMASEKDRNAAFVQAMSAQSATLTASLIDLVKAQVTAGAVKPPAEGGSDTFEKVMSTFMAGVQFTNETRAQILEAQEKSGGDKDSLETSLVQLAQGWLAAKATEPTKPALPDPTNGAAS